MRINIKEKDGYNIVNSFEVEEYISNLVMQVPGVMKVTHKSHLKKVINMISKDKHFTIDVDYLNENKVGIKVYVIIQEGLSISEITNSIQESIEYNLEKNYGLDVKYVDVYIRGLK